MLWAASARFVVGRAGRSAARGTDDHAVVGPYRLGVGGFFAEMAIRIDDDDDIVDAAYVVAKALGRYAEAYGSGISPLVSSARTSSMPSGTRREIRKSSAAAIFSKPTR